MWTARPSFTADHVTFPQISTASARNQITPSGDDFGEFHFLATICSAAPVIS
jgi:hypothetical protein